MHASAPLFAELATWAARGQAFVLAVVTDTGGSTPRLAGAVMGICADGAVGTVGGGAFEQRVIQVAHALLADASRRTATVDVHLVHELAMCCGGRMTAVLTRQEAVPRLWIYGAGHVGTALAPVALQAGFAVTVVDGRPEWAAPARFPPEVEVVDADPEDHVRSHPPSAEDSVVVMTHSHPLDEVLIRHLAAVPRAYLGLIGSARKRIMFEKRLESQGLTAEQLAQVRCPVGLMIDAETPGEIAVSIVAELVAVRRARGRLAARGEA